tara:strand:+ start:93 stop:1106 length:1014 start_codon:yes stop_codon:yes gene_type:complete
MDFQAEKRMVLDFYAEIQVAEVNTISKVMSKYYDEDVLWRGFHPFNELRGYKEVAGTFWKPLMKSFTSLQRRMDIFLAGENQITGYEGVWVVSMGHLMGLFDNVWLGIKPTHKIAMLRYCEFNKIENNKVTDVAMFFDIPHVMMQAGFNPFPPQTAEHLVQPGPMTHQGLMFQKQDPIEGKKTKESIEYMINDLKTWQTTENELLIRELRRSWNEDMIWWGPAGIGSTFTIERYAKQHSEPFRKGFKNRQFNGHLCRVAEGKFGGFFGWPNLTLTPSGGFMGMPASEVPGEMRVIDMYRREGNKLTENWVFIDLLHFWLSQGVDILERTAKINSPQE